MFCDEEEFHDDENSEIEDTCEAEDGRKAQTAHFTKQR